MEIAKTILQQLGGSGRLAMMTGANNFVALKNGVTFKIKNRKVNFIKITLNSRDLYDVYFYKLVGTNSKLISEHNDIYFDELKPLFEKETGMYLSFYMKGGKIKNDESKDMIFNQLKQIHHHEEELRQIIAKDEDIEPWVIAKMALVTSDLSDITHYEDGKTDKMSRGGVIKNITKQLDELGVKYTLSKSQVRLFDEINKPIGKDDNFYNKFDRIIDLNNLEGVVKTKMAKGGEVKKSKIIENSLKQGYFGIQNGSEIIILNKKYGFRFDYDYIKQQIDNTIISSFSNNDFYYNWLENSLREEYYKFFSELCTKFTNDIDATLNKYFELKATAASRPDKLYVHKYNFDLEPFIEKSKTLSQDVKKSFQEYTKRGSKKYKMSDGGYMENGGGVEKYNIKNKTKYLIYDGENLEMAGTVSILPNDYIQIKDPKGFVYSLSLLKQKYKNLKFKPYDFEKGGSIVTEKKWGEEKDFKNLINLLNSTKYIDLEKALKIYENLTEEQKNKMFRFFVKNDDVKTSVKQQKESFENYLYESQFAKGGSILNEYEQEEFDKWKEDGNVSKNPDGTYSTQDAQYSNSLKNLDELKKYFKKEFFSDTNYAKGGSMYKDGGEIKRFFNNLKSKPKPKGVSNLYNYEFSYEDAPYIKITNLQQINAMQDELQDLMKEHIDYKYNLLLLDKKEGFDTDSYRTQISVEDLKHYLDLTGLVKKDRDLAKKELAKIAMSAIKSSGLKKETYGYRGKSTQSFSVNTLLKMKHGGEIKDDITNAKINASDKIDFEYYAKQYAGDSWTKMTRAEKAELMSEIRENWFNTEYAKGGKTGDGAKYEVTLNSNKIDVLKDATEHLTNNNRYKIEEKYTASTVYNYTEFCDKCGRGIKGNPAFYIHMVAPNFVVPNDEQNNLEIEKLSIKGELEDMGYYPIGSECVKSYPKEYRFEVSKFEKGGKTSSCSYEDGGEIGSVKWVKSFEEDDMDKKYPFYVAQYKGFEITLQENYNSSWGIIIEKDGKVVKRIGESTFFLKGAKDSAIDFVDEMKNKYADGGEIDDEKPIVYIQDINSMNYGQWIDLSKYKTGIDVIYAIADCMLKWSKQNGEQIEEVSVVDYDNIPRNLTHEWMGEKDYDLIIKGFALSNEKDIPFMVIGEMIGDYSHYFTDENPTDLNEFFEERYYGRFDNETDLANEYIDNLSSIKNLPSNQLANNFDYEKFGQDERMNMGTDQEEEFGFDKLSDYELAEELIENEGGIRNLSENKLQMYFDYEAFGDYLSSYYSQYDGYYFRNN